MPCERDPEESARDVGHLVREATDLTRFLCEACGLLDAVVPEAMSPALRAWWARHREVDARRRAAEEAQRAMAMAREHALAKLTMEEQRLLHLA